VRDWILTWRMFRLPGRSATMFIPTIYLDGLEEVSIESGYRRAVEGVD